MTGIDFYFFWYWLYTTPFFRVIIDIIEEF
jgi:hypothetical protein